MYPFLMLEYTEMLRLTDHLYPGRPISESGRDFREWLCQVTGEQIADAPFAAFLNNVIPLLLREAASRKVPVSPTLKRWQEKCLTAA